jgi:hypothetical protein
MILFGGRFQPRQISKPHVRTHAHAKHSKSPPAPNNMVNFTLVVPRYPLHTITLVSPSHQCFELRPWQKGIFTGMYHTKWVGKELHWRDEHTPHCTFVDSGFRASVAAPDVDGYLDRDGNLLGVHATFNGIPTEESVRLSIRTPDGKSHQTTCWKFDTVAVLRETARLMLKDILLKDVPFADVRLFASGGKELRNDSATLEQRGIGDDGYVVSCRLSLHGAIKASPKFDGTFAPIDLPKRVAEWVPPFVRYNTKTKASEHFAYDHLQPTGFACLYEDVSPTRVVINLQLCDGHLVFKPHPDSDELVFPAASLLPITRVSDSHYSHSNNTGGSHPGYVDLEL